MENIFLFEYWVFFRKYYFWLNKLLYNYMMDYYMVMRNKWEIFLCIDMK